MRPGMVMLMAGAAVSSAPPPTVALVAQEHRTSVVSPADTTSSFTLGNDRVATGSGDAPYNWLDAAANPALYQVTVSEVSGAFTTGAAGTFSLGTTRTWTKERTLNTAGESIASARFQIALISTPGVILADAVISLVAEVTAGSSAPTVTLNASTEYGYSVSPDDAYGYFSLGNDRQATGSTSNYAWLSPDGTPSAYEVVVSEVTGAFATGSAGTFNLGATQTWTKTRTNNFAGTNTVTARYQIRRVDTPGIILADQYVTIHASVYADDPGGGGGGGGDLP